MKVLPLPENKPVKEEVFFPYSFWERNIYVFLLIMLFFSWLTYPLIFGLSHPKIFKIGMIILLSSAFLFILVSQIPARHLGFILEPKWLFPIACYIIYLVCFTLATFLQLDDKSFIVLLSTYIKILFVMILMWFLPWWLNIKAFRIYYYFIIFIALLAIVHFLLFIHGLTINLGTFFIPLGFGRPRTYENHGLAFIDPSYILHIGRYKLTRLQSFADEPGSFAHGILPALFWAWLHRKKFGTTVLTLGLLFTFSVGGILTAGIVGLLFACKRGWRTVLKVLSLLVALTILISLLVSPSILIGVNKYLKTKYEPPEAGAQSSFGTRLYSVDRAFQVLTETPWGYGASQAQQVAEKNLAVGWLVPLIEAGWIGGSAYFLAFTWLFLLAIILFFKEKNEIKLFVCTSYISIYIMAAQRAQIDSSFWLLWLVASFILLTTYQEKLQDRKDKAN